MDGRLDLVSNHSDYVLTDRSCLSSLARKV